MKKEYITPEVTIVELHDQPVLFSTSNPYGNLGDFEEGTQE